MIKMGGMGYWKQEARENLLGQIVRNEAKYLVSVAGVKENDGENTGKKTEGAYRLFEKLDETEIRKYAEAVSKENNVRLTKINIYSLKQPKLVRELSV